MSIDNTDRGRTGSIERVGLVGYGETGRLFARAFVENDIDVTVLTRSPDHLRERLSDRPITVAESYEALAAETDLVLSCVWPATAAEVAEAIAPGLAPGQPYLDLNSVSPVTTERIVDAVNETGGAPLKATIMGSAASGRDNVRLVLAGTERQSTITVLRAVEITVEEAGDDPTQPALLKMFRSMFTKGMRELIAETLAPAAAYGVHEEVLDDLSGLFDDQPVDEWMQTALENTPDHAERRLGELREVRRTTAEVGYRAPTIDETTALHKQLRDCSADNYVAVLNALESHLSEDTS